MIIIECSWCDAELAIDSLDATSVDCTECLVTVEFAADTQLAAIAA
jgi:hypothetical protein